MSSKPRTTIAMRNLIHEARAVFPLGITPDDICADECRGCSIKLLEYIAMELDAWEDRLGDGVVPTFGDLDRLGRSCLKIHRALCRNGLVEALENPD